MTDPTHYLSHPVSSASPMSLTQPASLVSVDSTAPSSSSPVSSAPRSSASSPSSASFPFQQLDAYRVARAMAALVHGAGITDPELRDQATRAAKSVFLNLCEGLPDDRPAMRRKYFASADGSLHETVGAVDLASAIGAIGHTEAADILALAFRLRGMLRGLMRRAVTARGA
jgi:four helix bundle protein